MKKNILCALILFTAGAVTSAAPQRADWWQSRAAYLESERAACVKKNSCPPELIALIEQEIKRAKEIKSLYESKGVSTTDEIRTAYSETAIADRTERAVRAHYAVYLLRYIATKYNAPTAALGTEDVFKLRMAEISKKHSRGTTSASLAKAARPRNAKAFSSELVLTAVLHNRKSEEEKNIRAITQAVVQKISGSRVTENELTDAICTETERVLSAYNWDAAYTVQPEFIDETWSGKNSIAAAEREASFCRRIAVFTGDEADDAVSRIQFFYHNPGAFEEATLRQLRSEYTQSDRFVRSKQLNATKSAVLEIPREPDMASMVAEIELFVKKKVSTFTGNEQESDFSESEREMQRISETYLSPVQDSFFRQEEKMRLLTIESRAADDGSVRDISPVNLDDFKLSKSILEKKIEASRVYRARTLELMRLLSSLRMPAAIDTFAEYTYRINRSKMYLSLVRDIEQSASAYSGGTAEINRTYSSAYIKSTEMIRFFSAATALSPQERAVMTSDKIKSAAKIKASYDTVLKTVLAEIHSLYTAHGHAAAQNSRIKKERSVSISQKAGEYEMEMLAESVKAYTVYFKTLTYGESALNEYLRAYTLLAQDAKQNVQSKNLSAVLAQKSIIGTAHIDRERLEQERIAKKFVISEIEKNLVRIAVVKEYCKHAGFTVSAKMSSAEIKDIQMLTKHAASVKIGQWTATEANIYEIDRKAAALLEQAVVRKNWEREGENHGTLSLSKTPRLIENVGIRIQIPEGWQTSGDGTEAQGAPSETFSNTDESARVMIVGLDVFSGQSEKSITDNWLIKQRKKLIKSSYQRQGDTTYYICVAGDAGKQITECVAFMRGEKVYIVAGQTSRERYRFFTGTAQAIAETAE